jgi:hypothetical protein
MLRGLAQGNGAAAQQAEIAALQAKVERLQDEVRPPVLHAHAASLPGRARTARHPARDHAMRARHAGFTLRCARRPLACALLPQLRAAHSGRITMQGYLLKHRPVTQLMGLFAQEWEMRCAGARRQAQRRVPPGPRAAPRTSCRRHMHGPRQAGSVLCGAAQLWHAGAPLLQAAVCA